MALFQHLSNIVISTVVTIDKCKSFDNGFHLSSQKHNDIKCVLFNKNKMTLIAVHKNWTAYTIFRKCSINFKNLPVERFDIILITIRYN